jgi:hypothetical protein
MRFSVIVPVALLGLIPLACGDSTPEANTEYNANASTNCPPGQYCPPGGGQPGGYPPGSYPSNTSPTPTGTAPPAGTAPASGGGSSATPIAPAAVAAATPVLTAMAAQEVSGMQPDGGAFAGQFQEGQTLEQQFNIQPGKCYSVVGVGIGIQELDISIAAQPVPNLPPTPLAQDQGSGPNATLGGKGNCFKNPLPIGGPAKVIVKATKGSGMAVAQIYVK